MADIVPTQPPPRAVWLTYPVSSKSACWQALPRQSPRTMQLVDLVAGAELHRALWSALGAREWSSDGRPSTAAGIDFKLSPSGAVSVPEAKVQEARIRLASQGLPQSDSMGIEMIQKDSALGNSTMMESARYQSVLETELGRTIIKVQGVLQSARVHLALPKPSVFLRDAHKTLSRRSCCNCNPGRQLEPGTGRRHRASGRLQRPGAIRERRDAGGSGRFAAELSG